MNDTCVPTRDARSRTARKLAVLDAVGDVDGWLLAEDVFKLYDLAYEAAGPILEIGTFHGRSAIAMAMALRDAGNPAPLVSLDVDPEALAAAGENARRKGVSGRITLVRGSAAAFFRATTGFVPAVVFVDGDHSAAGAARDLRALEPHVPDGGFLFLHDYADPRDPDPAEGEYGGQPGGGADLGGAPVRRPGRVRGRRPVPAPRGRARPCGRLAAAADHRPRMARRRGHAVPPARPLAAGPPLSSRPGPAAARKCGVRGPIRSTAWSRFGPCSPPPTGARR